MSSDKQTIYEFDLNIITDYFSNTERQGSGVPEITLKALSFIEGLTEKSKTAEEFKGYQRYEAGLYYKYKAYYCYAFYIGKR